MNINLYQILKTWRKPAAESTAEGDAAPGDGSPMQTTEEESDVTINVPSPLWPLLVAQIYPLAALVAIVAMVNRVGACGWLFLVLALAGVVTLWNRPKTHPRR